MAPAAPSEWRVFLAEAPHVPITVLLEDGVYCALYQLDANAWRALLEFLHEHADPRKNP